MIRAEEGADPNECLDFLSGDLVCQISWESVEVLFSEGLSHECEGYPAGQKMGGDEGRMGNDREEAAARPVPKTSKECQCPVSCPFENSSFQVKLVRILSSCPVKPLLGVSTQTTGKEENESK